MINAKRSGDWHPRLRMCDWYTWSLLHSLAPRMPLSFASFGIPVTEITSSRRELCNCTKNGAGFMGFALKAVQYFEKLH